jgi:glutathionyl-hydroquinone reductase
LSLLGLNGMISVGTVDPIRPESARGDWAFTRDAGGVDPVLGIRFLSEAYQKAEPGYAGRATVPAIIDTRTGCVVNNDYHRLSIAWETVEFGENTDFDHIKRHYHLCCDPGNPWRILPRGRRAASSCWVMRRATFKALP